MSKAKKYKNLEEIILHLKDSLHFLSHSFRIPGKAPEDLQQDMIQNIIEIYNANPDYYVGRKKGFWFIRSRWFLLNLRRKIFKRDPLANSISIDRLLSDYKD